MASLDLHREEQDRQQQPQQREEEKGEEEEEEEEEDVDFNPCLLASDASSSSSSDEDPLPSRKRPFPSDDAISRRTRARHSLTHLSLDDLETFLQESDPDDPLPLDDRHEYRLFLAAVLGPDPPASAPADDDDDADFDLEIEEALVSSDDDAPPPPPPPPPESRRRRPRRSRPLALACSSLRPILPGAIPPLASICPPPPPGNTCFDDPQIAQLNRLVQDHVQLLLQIFSLCVLDPSRQHLATDLRGLILQMSEMRRPRSILDVPGLAMAPEFLDDVSAAVTEYRGCQVDGVPGRIQMEKTPLFPHPNGAPTDDQSNEATEGSMPFQDAAASPPVPDSKPKKSLAAVLVEKTKRHPIALLPKCIADLAQRFVPFFDPEMYPRKPPPPPVANRVLFTDSEDGLLAMGLMEYNNDWAAIQKRFLPCKSKHQIFVRQKNRSSSKAPENPIKAVRRMKTSPLTANEMSLISKGLKLFKNDWNAVWQYFLRYRDPSLLPRQWRIACGTQKSYKKSDLVKEKRRAYEAERRRHKSLMNQHISAEKDVFDEHNSADDNMNADDEALVHEAFLAVSKPESSKTLPIINQTCVIPQIQNAKVVKLAPGLPPVNLPPSVRVISQSALKNFHSTPYSQCRSMNFFMMLPNAGETGNESARSKCTVSNDHTSDRLVNEPGSRVDPPLTEESHLGSAFVHPLLLQAPEDGYPEYYRNNSCSITTNTLNFFSGHLPRSNSNIHMHELPNRFAQLPQSAMTLKDNGSHLQTIDFHPLLQRSDNSTSLLDIGFANRQPSGGPSPVQKTGLPFNSIDSITCQRQIGQQHHLANPGASGQYERENDLDLEIHLCSTNKGSNATATYRNMDSINISNTDNRTAMNSPVALPSISNKDCHTTVITQSDINSASCGKSCATGLMKMAVSKDGGNRSSKSETEDEFLTEIVMEQEELSDTDEDIENVEFECEEMDDSGDELESEHP